MMFQLKTVTMSVLAVAASAGIGIAGSGHVDPETVRAAFHHQGAYSAARSAATTAKPTPLLTYSMLGSGTAMDPISGTCSGAQCDASGGECECLIINGTLDGTEVGKVPFTANITVNFDDCTNTGTTTPDANGFCCFGDGLLETNPPNGKSSDSLGMSFTGPVCNDPNSPPLDGGDTSVEGGFIISGANGAGKFAQSGGAGQLNIVIDINNNSLLSGNGLLQVVSPFGS